MSTGVSPDLAREVANLFTLTVVPFFVCLLCFLLSFVFWKACKLARFRQIFVVDTKVHFPWKSPVPLSASPRVKISVAAVARTC